MQEFINWLTSLDYAVIYTAVIGFATTWGGSMIALVITLIKHRIKNFNLEKALATMKIELNEAQNARLDEMQNTLVSRLDEMGKGLIDKEDEHAKERMDAINQMNEDVKAATEELNGTFNAYDAAKE